MHTGDPNTIQVVSKLLDLLPPPSPMSQYSYTGNNSPPEHLADVHDALMDDSDDPGRREYPDNSSNPGEYTANDLRPNPNVTKATGLKYLSMLLSNILTLSGNPCSKAAFTAELANNLNTPASYWDGLTALHWLSLNPLICLGAPSVYSGPSHPPSPSCPTTPLPTDDLNKAISNAVPWSTLLLAQGMMALSGTIELWTSTTTPSPPSPFPHPSRGHSYATPPPPPPAPAAAPATTPAPVSTPHAKKQTHAKTPTPAAAPSAKAPTPTPPIKPTPPPRPLFALAAKLPTQPSLVVTPHCAVGSSTPVVVHCNPQQLITHLNSMLLEGGHPITLSAAQWTAKNNLVLTAGLDTTAHHLNTTSHIISDSLAVFLSADTSPLPILAWENCKWGHLTINGIPTRASLAHGPYSPSKLHAALLADNPTYQMLRLTQAPSWVRAPHSYTPGSISSCVISFEDPSGESLWSLMAGWTLFAFRHSGELKQWKAKPCGSGAKPSIPPLT
ncbi:hypothetical protein EDB87DRAFT_1687176 [Lactarius vividus]|nr:hypothetical protein EDB87DRAFT_1687176 [Lactarius vividus]